MLRNYFKIFLRNLKKNPIYSILNILGLAIGLALIFLIVLYVRQETSYDSYNEKADRIYRALTIRKDVDWITPGTSYLLADVLRDEYPEVEAIARTRGVRVEIEFNDKLESNYFNCVDPEILDILTLEFVYGSRENALTEPYDILLSETRAAKHFPDENPVGKILSVELYGETINFTVKGVLKDPPKNTTFPIPFLVNLDIAEKFFNFINSRYGADGAEESEEKWFSNWYSDLYQTYILLKENTDPASFVEKMNEIPAKYHDEGMQSSYDLQPLRQIYLHSSDFTNNSTWSGSLSNIYLFSSIAFLILFIACTNFMILSTAQSMMRSKEIAVKKILGAARKNLIKQILFESILTAILACIFAIGFTYLFRSQMAQYLQVSLKINYTEDYLYPLALLAITMLVGLISGSYIAFYISRLNPLIILKNKTAAASSKSYFRRIVICLQMIIFIGLISASLIIYSQLHYVMNTDLGFDKEQLLTMELTSGDFSEHYESFMAELRTCPDIINAAGGFDLPPDDGCTVGKVPLFDNPDQQIEVEYYSVDFNFFETFKIELQKGRFFSRDFSDNTGNTVILNQSAVEKLHIDNPIGKTIEDSQIIGVIKDFHFHSMYRKIKPMVFRYCPLSHLGYVGIRMSPHNVPESIKFIEQTWNKFNIGKEAPFEFRFVDETFDLLYRDSLNFSRMILYCTIFAIFVACLGLFGLTMFITKQKTKEIGVRKVFGASPFRILKHLSIEIIWLSIISTAIAIPIVIYLMKKWLMNFAYHTEISFWIIIISGLTGLCISLLTMSFFSIKASLANPVDTMKYE
jgi:putative ABC transport system permease protein